MAQYDGAIRIVTKITTKDAEDSLASLEWKIKKSAKYMDELRSKMDALKGKKIYTEEFKKLEKQVAKADEELERLVNLKKEVGSGYGLNIGGEIVTIDDAIKKASSEFDSLYSKLNKLVAEGKDFTLGENTAEYTSYARQLQYEEEAIVKAGEKYKELSEKTTEALERQAAAQRKIEAEAEKNLQKETARIQKEAEMEDKLKAEATEEERLLQIRENAVVGNQRILEVIERRKQLLQEIADLEKAGVGIGYQQYDSAQQELLRLNQEVKAYNNDIGKVKENYKKLGEIAKKTLSGLSSMTGKVSSGIKEIGVFAKNAFSRLHKSVEKSNGMLATMKSRFKGLVLSLLIFNQISKAFNAMTASIREGYANLYNDNERFKRSVDSIKASALTLKNSLAAAFRPLVDVAIPYIQKAMDYMSGLLDSVGQFLAAITGQKMYTKAIKQTVDAYKDLKKAVEGYLSPLDEINKYQTSKGSDSGAGALGTMFQEVPIADRFKKLAQQIKGIFARIFEPLKEAWNREGKFVMDSWKSALKEIGSLARSIGSDFLEVWQQEKTVKIFEDILHIIGDIGLAISALAHNFRLAWEENEKGKRILEGIRDIVGVIAANIRHTADVTVEWAKELNFSPVLTKIQGLVESLVPVFDSLSGIIADFYEKVLLPLGKWTIEKGLPDLLQVFIDFNNKVDWEALRSRLAEFWEHLEPFAETVGEGLIIFIERCANALADFINSPAFDNFLTTIENWMDNVKPEDVADSLEALAKSIIALKAATLGFSAASKAISIFEKAIKVFEKLGSVVAFLKGIKIVPFLTSLFSAMNPGMIGELGLSLGRLLEGTFLDTSTWEGLPKKLHDAVTNAIDTVGQTLSEGATRAGTVVKKFLNGVFNWDSTAAIFEEAKENFKKGGIHIVEGIIEGFVGAIGFIVEPIGDFFTTFWNAICDVFGIHSPADTMIPIGENIVLGILQGITSLVEDVKAVWEDMKQTAIDIWNKTSESFGKVMDDLRSKASSKLNDIGLKWKSAWDGMRSTMSSIIGSVKNAISEFFNWVSNKVDDIKESLSNLGKSSTLRLGAGNRFLSIGSSNKYLRSAPSMLYASPEFEALRTTPIPKLATGAVIPANREFLAVLGDQKHGTNIEAPLDTIEQANERLLLKVLSRLGIDGNPVGGATYKFVAQLDGRTLFEETIKQGKIRQMSTGRDPFVFE